ncbi:MAG: shikimate kinase [Telmatospirillum sp.]|nr:shikimate kinase [Telmatospirillum sp.]MDR3437014.1 shikimate kinase [Telmatospirillum sp.]
MMVITADKISRSIVLVGLMGAGKSCVGRRLAQKLKLPFADADNEIEAAAGCSISEIFSRFGEPEFRAGERRVVGRLLEGAPCVLATGGGAFMDGETRRLIADKGISIWLRADLDLLVKRTIGRDHRPLLRGDTRGILQGLIEKRYPTYALADIAVDTVDRPPEVTVDRVLAALTNYLETAALPSQT